jgi:hypothetical protein
VDKTLAYILLFRLHLLLRVRTCAIEAERGRELSMDDEWRNNPAENSVLNLLINTVSCRAAWRILTVFLSPGFFSEGLSGAGGRCSLAIVKV